MWLEKRARSRPARGRHAPTPALLAGNDHVRAGRSMSPRSPRRCGARARRAPEVEPRSGSISSESRRSPPWRKGELDDGGPCSPNGSRLRRRWTTASRPRAAAAACSTIANRTGRHDRAESLPAENLVRSLEGPGPLSGTRSPASWRLRSTSTGRRPVWGTQCWAPSGRCRSTTGRSPSTASISWRSAQLRAATSVERRRSYGATEAAREAMGCGMRRGRGSDPRERACFGSIAAAVWWTSLERRPGARSPTRILELARDLD